MSSRTLTLFFLFSSGACLGGEVQELREPTSLRPAVDYELVHTAVPAATADGRVEVAEIFQYACYGCALFEPELERWSAARHEEARVVRIPAIWNELGELHARAFYTAEALGALDRMHAELFETIHVQKNRLETEGKLRDFFARFGIDEATFAATFRSVGVETKVRRARELVTRLYRIPETPAIVVDGQYLTRGGLAGSYERWFEVVDALVDARRPE